MKGLEYIIVPLLFDGGTMHYNATFIVEESLAFSCVEYKHS